MDNLDLSALLSSPEAMQQVMNVVKTLSQAVPAPEAREKPLQDDTAQSQSENNNNGEAPGEMSAAQEKPGADPALLRGAVKIFSEYSRDDDSIRLMRALKGHMQEAAEVDKAIEVLRLSRSVRAILRMLKGGSHVLIL